MSLPNLKTEAHKLSAFVKIGNVVVVGRSKLITYIYV